MNMIEQIKADRKGATIEWVLEDGCLYGKERGYTVPLFDICAYDENECAESDMARIARVPDMEAALIAAEELAETYVALCEMTGRHFHTHDGSRYVAYKIAIGDTK